MSRQFDVLPRAQRDLDDQAWYFAENANLEIALRFLACARATFELLAGNPQIGRACRIAGQVGVRVFRVCDFEKLLVFFRVDGERVLVLRVLHGARDLEALLRREGVLP